jgi:hypothetical protein
MSCIWYLGTMLCCGWTEARQLSEALFTWSEIDADEVLAAAGIGIRSIQRNFLLSHSMRFTPGGFQKPSPTGRIEGCVSFGQQRRITR